MPPDRFIRERECRELTGLSRTTIWRRELDGTFPKRRKVGPHLIAWRSDEIEEWIMGLPLAPPAGTGRRIGVPHE